MLTLVDLTVSLQMIFVLQVMKKNQGVWGSALNVYLTWTGRYSANLLDALFGYWGPRVIPYVSITTLTVWFLVTFFTIYQIFKTANGLGTFLEPALGSLYLISSILVISPDIYSSFYWGQGMRSVVPPLILFTLIVGFIFFTNNTKAFSTKPALGITIVGILTFVNGGFNETFTALQVTLFAFALLISLNNTFLRLPKQVRLLIISGLIFSLIALLFDILAPGNKVRQSCYPTTPDLLQLIRISASGFKSYFTNVLNNDARNTLMGVIALFAACGSGFLSNTSRFAHSKRNNLALLLGINVIMLICLLACFVPSAYGMSASPPLRNEIIPSFVLVCFLSIDGWFIGKSLFPNNHHRMQGYLKGQRILIGSIVKRRDYWTRILVIVMLSGILLTSCLNSIIVAYDNWQLRQQYLTYAIAWDKRDKRINQAILNGEKQVIVQKLYHWSGSEINENVDDWKNVCFNNYYGIKVIVK
jgi:hypothetical protein